MSVEAKEEKLLANSDHDLVLRGQVKLDSTTPLENFFYTGIWASPILFVFGLILIIATKSAWFVPAIFLGIFGFIPSVVFYFLTDNYYILDCDKKLLTYRFKFAFYEKKSVIARFSDIHAVTLKAKVTKSSGDSDFTRKRDTFRKYQILIVLASGKVIPLSDLTFKVFEKEEKLGKKIAQTTGATFVQCQPSKTSSPGIAKGHDGRYTFNHMKSDLMLNLRISKATLNALWASGFALLIIIPGMLSLLDLI